MTVSAAFDIESTVTPASEPEGLIDATGEAIGQVDDHCADGLAKLLHQFQDSPLLQALICSFLRRCDTLETAMWQLYTERTIDTAAGVQLDGWGDIVGQGRNDLADDDYRGLIRARLRALRSHGRAEDLLEVILLILGQDYLPTLEEQYPAAIQITYDDAALTIPRDSVAAMVRSAKAAGVRLLQIFLHTDPAETFAFGAAAGEYSTTTGHASAASHPAGAGGGYASVIE